MIQTTSSTPKPLSCGDIRDKRIRAGIPGHILCKKLNRSRAWLTTIERDYFDVPAEELARIDAALDELIRLKM